MTNIPKSSYGDEPAPFSKHEIRMVYVASNLIARIDSGARASEAVEAALASSHRVVIPMLDEHGQIELRIEDDWRIPVAQHGAFRGLVRYMRLENTTGLTPDVIVGRAEAMQMRMGQTGR